MSPLLDVQPQLPTVYRIRLGRKVGNRPEHLDGSVRVTSQSRRIVEQIAEAYGGTPLEEWAAPDGPQLQTILPPEPLQVILMPGQALSQWWEHWSAGGCDRRCDGETCDAEGALVSCLCVPDVRARMRDKRACKPVTRLTVLLPRVPVLGAGRLDTHGIIAAQGIGATIALAQQALDTGVMVRATLSVRKRGNGAKQYVWPELLVSMSEVKPEALPWREQMQALAQPQTRAIPAEAGTTAEG